MITHVDALVGNASVIVSSVCPAESFRHLLSCRHGRGAASLPAAGVAAGLRLAAIQADGGIHHCGRLRFQRLQRLGGRADALCVLMYVDWTFTNCYITSSRVNCDIHCHQCDGLALLLLYSCDIRASSCTQQASICRPIIARPNPERRADHQRLLPFQLPPSSNMQ